MKNLKIISIPAVLAVSALVGCAQTKGDAHPKATAKATLLKDSLSLPYDKCTNGMLDVALLKDYKNKKGEPVVRARGFRSEEQLPEGLTAKNIFSLDESPTSMERKKINDKLSKVKLVDMGDEISLNLGSPAQSGDNNTVQTEGAFQKFDLVKNSEKKNVTVSLKRKEGAPSVYQGTADLSSAEIFESGSMSTRNFSSFVMADKTAQTMKMSRNDLRLPSDIEGGDISFEKGFPTVAPGTTIKFDVAPKSDADGKTVIMVQLMDTDDKHKVEGKYKYTTYVEDKNPIQIPTDQIELPKGEDEMDLKVNIARLAMTNDNGFCTRTGSGVVTTGKIEKPKQKQQ